MTDTNLLTREETCNYLRISMRTLHLYMEQGKLTPVKRGHRSYFDRNELNKLIGLNGSSEKRIGDLTVSEFKAVMLEILNDKPARGAHGGLKFGPTPALMGKD